MSTEDAKKVVHYKMDPAFRKRGAMAIVACLIGFILAAIMTNDSTNVLTTVLPDLVGWTQTQITFPGTVGGWCALVITILAGTLVKKFGTYNCLRVGYVILGVAVIAVGVGGNAANYQVYFVAIVVTRMAQALTFFSSVTLVTDWFLEWRGRALGIVTMGPPISSACLVPILTYVATNIGFNVGWIAMGVIGLVFAAVLCLFGKSKPEDYGWQQDGYNRPPEVLAERGMDDQTPNIWTLDKMLKTKEFYILTISGALGGMIFGAGLMIFIAIATSAGIPQAQALVAFSVGSALAIPFSFVSGMIDDKFGTKRAYLMIFAFTFIMPICMAIMLRTGAVAMLVICAFCVGVLAGCLMNVNPSIKQWAFGRKAFVDFNRIAQAVENACQTLGVLILSMFVDRTGTYFTGFIVLAVMSIVVFCLVLTTKSHSPEVIGFEAAQASAEGKK